jgi:hypothetical protein
MSHDQVCEPIVGMSGPGDEVVHLGSKDLRCRTSPFRVLEAEIEEAEEDGVLVSSSEGTLVEDREDPLREGDGAARRGIRASIGGRTRPAAPSVRLHPSPRQSAAPSMATNPFPFIADSRASVIARRGHLGNPGSFELQGLGCSPDGTSVTQVSEGMHRQAPPS